MSKKYIYQVEAKKLPRDSEFPATLQEAVANLARVMRVVKYKRAKS